MPSSTASSSNSEGIRRTSRIQDNTAIIHAREQVNGGVRPVLNVLSARLKASGFDTYRCFEMKPLLSDRSSSGPSIPTVWHTVSSASICDDHHDHSQYLQLGIFRRRFGNKNCNFLYAQKKIRGPQGALGVGGFYNLATSIEPPLPSWLGGFTVTGEHEISHTVEEKRARKSPMMVRHIVV